MNTIGRSTDEPAYGRVLRSVGDTRLMVLSLMADEELDAPRMPEW